MLHEKHRRVASRRLESSRLPRGRALNVTEMSMRSRGRLTPSLSPPSSYSAHSHTSGGLVWSSSLFNREARRSPILSEHCIDTRAKLRRSSASAIVDDRRPTLDWRGLVLVYCRVANTSRTLLAASPSAFEFPVSTIVYTRPRTSARTESCLLLPLCPLYYKSSRTNIRRAKDVRQCLSLSLTHTLSLSHKRFRSFASLGDFAGGRVTFTTTATTR